MKGCHQPELQCMFLYCKYRCEISVLEQESL